MSSHLLQTNTWSLCLPRPPALAPTPVFLAHPAAIPLTILLPLTPKASGPLHISVLCLGPSSCTTLSISLSYSAHDFTQMFAPQKGFLGLLSSSERACPIAVCCLTIFYLFIKFTPDISHVLLSSVDYPPSQLECSVPWKQRFVVVIILPCNIRAWKAALSWRAANSYSLNIRMSADIIMVHTTRIKLFHSSFPLMMYIVIVPKRKWRFSDIGWLAQVPQLVGSRAGIGTQVAWLWFIGAGDLCQGPGRKWRWMKVSYPCMTQVKKSFRPRYLQSGLCTEWLTLRENHQNAAAPKPREARGAAKSAPGEERL